MIIGSFDLDMEILDYDLEVLEDFMYSTQRRGLFRRGYHPNKYLSMEVSESQLQKNPDLFKHIRITSKPLDLSNNNPDAVSDIPNSQNAKSKLLKFLSRR